MSIEVRGLIAAVIAALVVLGGAFGVAAVVRGVDHSPPMPANQAAPAGQSAASGPQPALVSEGQGYYQNSCASCHGSQGEGNIGPKLAGAGLSDAGIATAIQNGFPPQMPAFGAKYHAQDIQAITAYIHTRK